MACASSSTRRCRPGSSRRATEVVLGPFTESETLLTAAGQVGAVRTQGSHAERCRRARRGPAREADRTLPARIAKLVDVTRYAERPRFLFLRARYTNDGPAPVDVRALRPSLCLRAARTAEPAFWSYQSASYENRPDWVLPVAPASQRNFLGMNATDYGGGTPVLDVWRRDVGLAIGHVELVPKQVSLPVRAAQRRRRGARARRERDATPGARRELRDPAHVRRRAPRRPLRDAAGLQRGHAGSGPEPPNAPEDAFEPIWCAWGYGRDFTPRRCSRRCPSRSASASVGRARRRLADGDRRLDARADKFPQATPT